MAAPWGYFDTSVLVKRYVREPGSMRARSLLSRHRLLSSAIAPIEAMSALRRRWVAGEIAGNDLALIISRIQQDRGYWELVELSPLVLGRAEELVQTTDLRTLDALHVASAIIIQASTGLRIPFITGDIQQREAAAQMELDVVWVG